MKRIAIAAVVAVGLAGLGVLAVPLLVSPDVLKQRIAERLSGATGRAVTITGEPSLSIYPHLAISVSGVTIANPKDMGDDPFVAADEVSTRIRLLPLLLGRTEFDVFELTRPRIHLLADGNGRSNWQMTGDNAADTKPAIADLALGRLQMVNGSIVYDNLASKQHEEMTAVDLSLTWPSPDAAVSGNGKLQWRGETVEFNGTVAQPLDLIAGKGSPVRFGIASTPLRVSFNGKALGLDNRHLEGDTSVTTPSLRRVVEWLGTPMGNGSILGPASIEGTMTWLGPTISFSKASVGLDGNEAQGFVSIDFSGARPAIQGTFAAAKLDLSPYFEAAVADMSTAGPWPFAPATLPLVDRLDTDLRISAGQVLVGQMQLGNVAATAAMKDGSLALNIGEAQLYGGKFGARFVATMQGDKLAGSIKGRVDAMPVQLPLNDILASGALTGATTATFNVGARGATWGEVARSAAGTADINIANGTITGFDVKELAGRMTDPLAEPMAPGAGATDFTHLAGTLAIESSILSTADLAIEGENYTVALAGRGSLLTGSVEAKAKLATKEQQTPIPLTISGTWRAPLIAPDQVSLRQVGAGQPRG